MINHALLRVCYLSWGCGGSPEDFKEATCEEQVVGFKGENSEGAVAGVLEVGRPVSVIREHCE